MLAKVRPSLSPRKTNNDFILHFYIKWSVGVYVGMHMWVPVLVEARRGRQIPWSYTDVGDWTQIFHESPLNHWASPKGHFLVSSLLWSQKPSLGILNTRAVCDNHECSAYPATERQTPLHTLKQNDTFYLHGHIISVAGGRRWNRVATVCQSTSESSLKVNNWCAQQRTSY